MSHPWHGCLPCVGSALGLGGLGDFGVCRQCRGCVVPPGSGRYALSSIFSHSHHTSCARCLHPIAWSCCYPGPEPAQGLGTGVSELGAPCFCPVVFREHPDPEWSRAAPSDPVPLPLALRMGVTVPIAADRYFGLQSPSPPCKHVVETLIF